MIVPIWRSRFLFRFKRERTTPESLMGQDSGFVLVLKACRHSGESRNPDVLRPRFLKVWIPVFAGMTVFGSGVNHEIVKVN